MCIWCEWAVVNKRYYNKDCKTVLFWQRRGEWFWQENENLDSVLKVAYVRKFFTPLSTIHQKEDALILGDLNQSKKLSEIMKKKSIILYPLLENSTTCITIANIRGVYSLLKKIFILFYIIQSISWNSSFEVSGRKCWNYNSILIKKWRIERHTICNIEIKDSRIAEFVSTVEFPKQLDSEPSGQHEPSGHGPVKSLSNLHPYLPSFFLLLSLSSGLS